MSFSHNSQHIENISCNGVFRVTVQPRLTFFRPLKRQRIEIPPRRRGFWHAIGRMSRHAFYKLTQVSFFGDITEAQSVTTNCQRASARIDLTARRHLFFARFMKRKDSAKPFFYYYFFQTQRDKVVWFRNSASRGISTL